jgi:hypothetical protein
MAAFVPADVARRSIAAIVLATSCSPGADEGHHGVRVIERVVSLRGE